MEKNRINSRFRMILLLCWTLISYGSASKGEATEPLQCSSRDGTIKTGFDNCFKCIGTNEVVLSKNVCDEKIDCSDFSDECLCSRQTIPVEICNILYDANTQSLTNCGDTHDFSGCKDAICRNMSDLCVGNKYCVEYAKKEFLCKDDSALKIGEFRTITCDKTNKNGTKGIIKAITCDGIIECDSREDECHSECSVKSGNVYCRKEFSCIPGSWICDGEWDSPTLPSCGGTRIEREESECSGRFYCQSRTKISVENSKVCNYNMDCDDGSDESLNNDCADKRYYCHDADYLATQNLSEVDTAFIASSERFDGKKDCPDGRDECHIGPLSFHSETEMIASGGLRWMVWISWIVAFFGNVYVIYFTLYTIVKKRKSMNRICCGHHTLLLNLSLADLLMSMYLLAVGIKSVSSSGDYCEEDLQWRSSATCTGLGVISMISSEMSVMIMLSMSVFRFVTIYKPLLTYKSKETDYIVKAVVNVAWLLAIGASIFPLLGEMGLRFAHDVALHCHIFHSHVMKVDAVEMSVSKYFALMQKLNGNLSMSYPTTISEMNQILESICPNETPPRWFGFYGQNSVCMPRIFARPTDPVWEVSIAMITYNIGAFFILIIFYVLIIKVSTQNSKKLGQDAAIPKCKLQARVTRLLLSDFACWIPVCIIGFLYASGRTISPNLYAACGIVLLPINSALNPLLYSNYCDKLIGAALGVCGKKVDLPAKACTKLTKVSTHSDSNGSGIRRQNNTESTDLMGRSIGATTRDDSGPAH